MLTVALLFCSFLTSYQYIAWIFCVKLLQTWRTTIERHWMCFKQFFTLSRSIQGNLIYIGWNHLLKGSFGLSASFVHDKLTYSFEFLSFFFLNKADDQGGFFNSRRCNILASSGWGLHNFHKNTCLDTCINKLHVSGKKSIDLVKKLQHHCYKTRLSVQRILYRSALHMDIIIEGSQWIFNSLNCDNIPMILTEKFFALFLWSKLFCFVTAEA